MFRPLCILKFRYNSTVDTTFGKSMSHPYSSHLYTHRFLYMRYYHYIYQKAGWTMKDLILIDGHICRTTDIDCSDSHLDDCNLSLRKRVIFRPVNCIEVLSVATYC